MLTYSSEAAFLLAVFAMVLSGLPLVALAWIHRTEGTPSKERTPLVAAFSLFAAAFAGQAVYYRLTVPADGPPPPWAEWLPLAIDGVRVMASASLIVVARDRWPRTRTLALVVLGVAGFAVLSTSIAFAPAFERIDTWTPQRAADAVFHVIGSALMSGVSRLYTWALALLALARISALGGLLHSPAIEATWSAGWTLSLVGLILLAFVVERQSRRTLLLHVLRFNLVFLTLAASLTMLLAELTRHQFVDLSALQVRDVAEFARGFLMQQLQLAKPAADALASPALTDRIIREFGRYPDLRRVRLDVEGHAMELAINDTGEITSRFWSGMRPEPSKVTAADFSEARLLVEPVMVDGGVLGHVELHHSVLRLNANIGQQMSAVFLVFTVFVVVGSVVTGVLVQVADRTIGRQYEELAEAQRRLSQSDRLASVGAVASAVAHEINNPAGVLVARSDYLLSVIRDEPVGPAIQEDLETIRRQAQRIAKTVRDLLQSAARTRSASDLVDMGSLVTGAIALVQPMRWAGVTFQWQVPPRPVLVWADRDRLEQVLVNLLSNAAQAIRDKGLVTVSAVTRAGGGWADLVVQDTGSGIRPEDLGRIFDPFFTTKEPGVGTGLGLSIVRRIVHDHGGHIDVDTALGRGTAFRIALPAVSAERGTAATTVGVAGSLAASGARGEGVDA